MQSKSTLILTLLCLGFASSQSSVSACQTFTLQRGESGQDTDSLTGTRGGYEKIFVFLEQAINSFILILRQDAF